MPERGMTLDKVLKLQHGKDVKLHWTLDSHTFSGKLETKFFANNFSIKAKTAGLDSQVLTERTGLPVDGVKQLGSFESTRQIEEFSCDHVLIPINIRGHSKLSSTNVKHPTMFRN